MMLKMSRVAVLVVIFVAILQADALAWGSRAQRAISGTAIQVIRRTFSDAFKAGGSNYSEDVFAGAVTGPSVLNNNKPITSQAEALVTIENEIALLREVRSLGVGSYFSFRMGALGALASDLMLPYALTTTEPKGDELRQRIHSDIDTRVASYTYSPLEKHRTLVRNPRTYFEKHQGRYFSYNQQVIADDYAGGQGYNGFLLEGGPMFFAQAIEVTADVWFTVLTMSTDATQATPSKASVTWYLVDEIRYLLVEKDNYNQAIKAYDDFEMTNPGIPEAYEAVGDLFYAQNTLLAQERAVREWRVAYSTDGSDRRRIGRKLAEHYIKIGNNLLEKGTAPGAADEDLPNALNAYTSALEFDQTNAVAASRIKETNAAIMERKERREMNMNFVATAEKVMVQAQKTRADGDFGNAIATYERAKGLFEAVTDEFIEQSNVAKESIKTIEREITDMINQVLDSANDAIDQGDKAISEHRFTDAIGSYERVKSIVSIISDDPASTHGKDRQELEAAAAKKIDEAKLAEDRWKKQQAAGEQAAKGAAPKAAGN